MDKITIIPESVRGYGDVVSPKTLEDFEVYQSELSFEDSVYTLEYSPIPASVGLSADKSILSYADSESATLSATVLDQSSSPMSGVTVEFFKGSTSLGTADTNSSGVATKTYASAGSGVVSFTARVGTVVSETVSVFDAKWFDLGTDNTNSMFASSSTMTITYGNEYCSLSETTSGTTGVVVTDTSHYIQPNDIFEFDYYQVDGVRNYSFLYLRNKANSSSLAIIPHLYDAGKQVGTWVHYKCQISDNKMYIYIDDSTTPLERTLSNTDTDYRLYWNTPNTITEMRFKNFKVYTGDRPFDGVTLTTDKSILSYADSETATLTAQLTDNGDPVNIAGVTVEFLKDNVSLGTAETNSSGIATKTYASTGAGDLSFTASVGTISSETYGLEDCWYYNDGTNTSSLECPSGVSVTTSDGYLVLPKSSSEKIITVPKSLANSDNWEYSVKLARKDGNKCIGLTFNDSTYYLSSNSNSGKYYCHFSSDEYWNTDSAVNDVITVRRQNGITKILINTVEQTSNTVSHKSSFKCGFYTINSTYQYVDDIKLKPL